MALAVKWSAAFIIVVLLVLQLVCCSRHSPDVRDDDGDDSRHGAVPRYSSPARRQSTVRRWLERVRPHRLHGSVSLRPGRGLHLNTGVSWDFDFDGKWWTGENICVHINETSEELTTDDNHRRLSYTHACNETSYTQYTCTTVRTRGRRMTTTTSVYQCCHGYRRSRDYPTAGRCIEDSADRPPATVMETLLSLEASEMLKTLQVTGLLKLLNTGNHTLFAPTNEAFASFTPRTVNDLRIVRASNELMDKLSTELRDVTAGHVVPGHVFAADLHVGGQMRLRTVADSPRYIWLNKYDVPHKQLVTANCAPLVYADLLANSGVVHVVDSVLPPADQSLQQLIRSRRELSTFYTMLQTLELNNGSQYTVFAPSNLAFDRLLPSVRDKILLQDGCGPDIMRQHVLPGIICSESVGSSRSVTLRNVGGRYMTLMRPQRVSTAVTGDEAGSAQTMRVEGARSTHSDIMAYNGVLHIIDEVLFHSSVDGLIGVLKRSGEASRFVTLMELTGITQQLQRMHEFTIFIPSNDAVQAMAENLNGMSREELTELVRYHMVPSRVTGTGLHNDRQLMTMSSADKRLLVKRYHSFPFGGQSRRTVQCAAVERSDVNRASVCGGVGHIVNQVMRPPATSVMDVLTSDSEYSFLVELIDIAGLTDLLQQTDAPITFFAPTNQAFQTLSSDTVNKLMSNGDRARQVIRSHIVSDWLCCGGVFASRQLFQLPVRQVNLDGWAISLQRTGDTVSYGDVPVASCDHTANNGVVHKLNSFVPVVINRYVAPVNGRWSTADTLKTLLRYIRL